MTEGIAFHLLLRRLAAKEAESVFVGLFANRQTSVLFSARVTRVS